MSDLPLRLSRLVISLGIILADVAAVPLSAALAVEPAKLEDGLDLEGPRRLVSLEEAMAILNVPSVSLALMDSDRIVLARAYGQGATPETLYKAPRYRNSCGGGRHAPRRSE